MAKYKAYPEYKDSGVEWLGDIPGHWKTISISRLFSRIKRTGYTEKELLSVYRDYGVIPKSSRDDNNNKPSEDLSPYQLVQPNDLVMNKMKAWQGSIAISEYEGIVSPAYFVYQPNNSLFELAHPKYAHYLLRNPIYVTQYLSRSKGIRVNQWDLDPDEFRNIELLLPSKVEQEKIYNFLDHETAKIDNLIDKQQQLIELLKEKRQAVISHAVTKGLNPDVPMKDSGIEWLGEVPEHWIVRRLKHTSTLQSGMPKGKDLTGKNSISVPMLRVANVQDGYLDLTEVNNINIEPSQLERYLLRDGDVLMNEGGDNDKLGRGAVWNAPIDNCIHQNHVFAIRPFSIESEWLDMLTRADYAKFHFYRVAKQSTNLASISSTNVKETPLLIPPKKERDEILKFINFQLNKIKATEEFSTKQVVLLQERRTALISAAVTGKIDVRDWVAPDMQDAEEPQETTA
ncbi:restriction endonuclease subunit S [Serratia marcescens]|uniref:restriction endonuclease subunit S n=1 Tax=Serratia marcescens TaxID=615 RepID=UPI0013DC3CC6|nr:restriction endonuclease subunit S [Serratia marcescens]MBH2834819.1 restriction endonuclease subunit S [Serratia marcescens]MDU7467505.1 restriction endonuclease subunit S [Serratia marcescens]WAY99613.1 restriction endonuclease subunit S [Serratia marcescens]HEJ7091642.1 restriction endonuclease subunit S [Serratia marcescens]